MAETSVHHIEEEFRSVCMDAGYAEIPSVPVTGGFDPTTRLIGSHISVFKPFFIPDFSPGHPVDWQASDYPLEPGIFMVQDCIRTRNLKNMQPENFSKWASYFRSLGTLTTYERLAPTIEHAAEFLGKLCCDAGYEHHVLIRASSDDEDMLDAIRTVKPKAKVEVDTLPPNSYAHVLGDDRVSGRNINFALFNQAEGAYMDVGNVISIKREAEPKAVELALGASTINAYLNGLHHPVLSFTGDALEPSRAKGNLPLIDSIVTSLVMLSEGLAPGGTNNKRRLLRSYLREAQESFSSGDLDKNDIQRIVSCAATSIGITNVSSDDILEHLLAI